MKKAELQFNIVRHEASPILDTKVFDVHATLAHLIEVINEMQEEIATLSNKGI